MYRQRDTVNYEPYRISSFSEPYQLIGKRIEHIQTEYQKMLGLKVPKQGIRAYKGLMSGFDAASNGLYQQQLMGSAPRFAEEDWKDMGKLVYKAFTNMGRFVGDGTVSKEMIETDMRQSTFTSNNYSSRLSGMGEDFDPRDGGHKDDQDMGGRMGSVNSSYERWQDRFNRMPSDDRSDGLFYVDNMGLRNVHANVHVNPVVQSDYKPVPERDMFDEGGLDRLFGDEY